MLLILRLYIFFKYIRYLINICVASYAFIFSQLAKAWSFDVLSTLFGIERSTARRIFWDVAKLIFQTHIAMPDLLTTDTEKLFEDLYDDLDPFQKTFYGAFKDPKSKLLNINLCHTNINKFL